MLLNAYLLINCDCKSPQRALQGFFFFLEHSIQDRMVMMTVQVST